MTGSFIQAVLGNALLFSALIASIFSSIVSGIIGSYVVVKRVAFISGSITHSILGGIGVCLWLQRAQGIEGASPLIGALIAGVMSALLIGLIHLYWHEREDSVIAAVWSIGMAVGVLFISQTPGFNVELTNFLIGNILWVTPADLWILGGLDVFILIVVFLLHKRFVAICFDEAQAQLQGLPVKLLYLLLLVLISITIVLLVQVVGILLVITMLTIPAAIANLFTGRLSSMMGVAIVISALLCILGTAFAYEVDWPPGATIALLAGVCYLLALLSKSRLFTSGLKNWILTAPKSDL